MNSLRGQLQINGCWDSNTIEWMLCDCYSEWTDVIRHRRRIQSRSQVTTDQRRRLGGARKSIEGRARAAACWMPERIWRNRSGDKVAAAAVATSHEWRQRIIPRRVKERDLSEQEGAEHETVVQAMTGEHFREFHKEVICCCHPQRNNLLSSTGWLLRPLLLAFSKQLFAVHLRGLFLRVRGFLTMTVLYKSTYLLT